LDRPRKENTVADFLSRIQNDNKEVLVEDNFPNEYVFAVFIKSPWFVDISNYLDRGKLPSYLSLRGKKLVIRTSASYSWINEELCKTRPKLIIRRCVI